MVQTSSVKMGYFFDLFRVYKWIDFALEKVLSMLRPSSPRNLYPSKTVISKFYFPENGIDGSITPSYAHKMTQITETKKWTSRTFWKAVFSVAPIPIKLQQKINFEKLCLQWRMKCSWGTCPLVYMFDQNQLIRSVNSAKCRKRSQILSLSFT